MKKSIMSIFMGVIFFGSIWGVLEATMGNILHFIGLHPYTGAIMTSIGVGLMSLARRLYRFRGIGITMGITASLFKAVDFFIPGSNVIRPIVAILMTAIAFEAVTYVIDMYKSTNISHAIAGFSSGYLAITGFAFFTAYVLKFYYWLDKGFFGIVKYLLIQGWMFAVGSMLTFLIGVNIVDWLENFVSLEEIVTTKPFYATSAGFAFACLVFVVVV